MHVRPSAWAAALLPLALAGTLLAAPSAIAADPAAPAAPVVAADRVPTTGRLITTTTRGVVLLNENGKKRTTLLRARNASLVDMYAGTGVYLWSRSKGTRPTYHVANLYGADLGAFKVPEGASVPAIDSGGYVAYWVRPSVGSTPAAVMKLELNDPQATPVLVRDLGLGSAPRVSVSPDYQTLAIALDTPAGRRLHLVAANGTSDRTVTLAPGATVYGDRMVWSPDSGRVAFTAGTPPQPVGTIYYAPVAGDFAPVAVKATASALYDWSPDGNTLLAQTPAGLAGVAVATGSTTATYDVKSAPAGTGVFWSGLKKGAEPADEVGPKLKVREPSSTKVKAWRTIRGTASDKGGSLLRYVIFSAYQQRGNTWWGLVGNGKHPTWKKFPNRIEAELFAKERRTKITGDQWALGIPKLTAGRLVLVVKAADGAGNNTWRTVTADLR